MSRGKGRTGALNADRTRQTTTGSSTGGNAQDMTKGDKLKVRQGWRSPGWAIQPSSGEPDTGEPDARKRARPVREGAVGNLRKPVAPVVRRRESQQGAGRLLHTPVSSDNSVGFTNTGVLLSLCSPCERLPLCNIRNWSGNSSFVPECVGNHREPARLIQQPCRSVLTV